MYDTREWQWGQDSEDRVVRTKHQLPPLIQVTMIAVDETDMARWLVMNGNREPDFVSDSLFKSQRSLEQDLDTLRDDLNRERVRYRVFTTTVRMRESKWTETDEDDN